MNSPMIATAMLAGGRSATRRQPQPQPQPPRPRLWLRRCLALITGSRPRT